MPNGTTAMRRINTSLDTIIENHTPTAILVDASGVLYNDSGTLANVGNTIASLSAQIPVWVITNNTTHSIPEIASFLNHHQITIPESQIISSGLGLSLDPELASLIRSKSVYTLGNASSQYYVTLGEGIPVPNPDDADAIVLAASCGEKTYSLLSQIADSLRRKIRPVICVNPDHYIYTGSERYPVMGYYAAQLAKKLDIEITWMGKPDPRFSPVVSKVLSYAGITLDESVWFFDDNPKNVHQLTTDLEISGATVMDTGLCAGLTLDEIDSTFGVIPTHRIPQLTREFSQ